MAAQRAHPQVSCAGALRRALGQAARELAGLQLTVGRPVQTRQSLAELLEQMEATSLLAIVEGPGEALGLVVLDPGLTAALVEMQTTGMLAAHPAAAGRRPTRVDAAMCAPVIDAMLGGAEGALSMAADPAARDWSRGYRYASFLDTPAALVLLLEDVTYSVLSAGVTMGEGDRAGRVMVCLPTRRPESADPPPASGRAGAMERVVMAAPARLRAVLHRRPTGLGQLAALRPGMVLTLPRAALEAVALESADGRRMATARLGQSRGFRALRLGALRGPGAQPPPLPDPDAAFLAATPPGKGAQSGIGSDVPHGAETGAECMAAGLPDAPNAAPAPAEAMAPEAVATTAEPPAQGRAAHAKDAGAPADDALSPATVPPDPAEDPE